MCAAPLQLIAAGLGTRVDRLIEQHESPILKSLERILLRQLRPMIAVPGMRDLAIDGRDPSPTSHQADRPGQGAVRNRAR